MENELIFLSAGDPSGDIAAARLLASLKKIKPNLNSFGLGGEKLEKIGHDLLIKSNSLAIMGFWEITRKLWFFRQLLVECVKQIKNRKPKAIILVDYPGFNLRLAKSVKSLGIPIIYYISPQVWAWGHRRMKSLKELVNLMLIILPFEEQFFTGSGINYKFVGHYLLEDIPPEYIASPVPSKGCLTLMPGSRLLEIKRMLEPMLHTASIFNRKYGTRTIVAGLKDYFDYEKYLYKYKDYDISLLYDDSRKAIYESMLVLTASGTATLEAAIIGRPMVVVYKTGYLTYQIAKRIIKLNEVALVNLILEDKVVPELIQSDANPEKMVAELDRLYNNETYYSSIKEKLNKVPALLGGKGASERAARLIVECVNQ